MMRMPNPMYTLATALIFTFGAVGLAHAQLPDRATAVAAIDWIVRAAVDPDNPRGAAGMTVGIMIGSDTVMLRGYGMADVELQVPTPDHAVYEIGSVTKQFTSAAILKLRDAGKLDLDADISEYLPEYDTQGHRIPLRRLLDHTSGIRGYTELPLFGRLAVQSWPRDSLVAMFAREPFDFTPGEALIYNNSAYFLLGLIIEKVSGSTYADYIEREFFEPLGMSGSSYCSNDAVVPRRAKGYSRTPAGLRRADYIDHTWPYAAGSICSTAGDLIAWNRALHAGDVLSPASYQELTTPVPLLDGTPVRYAMGLMRSTAAGQPTIGHGGGIPGFLSHLVYVPEHDATIVVLANTAGPTAPSEIAGAAIEKLFGTRPLTPHAVPYSGDLAALAGSYRGRARGRDMTLEIRVDGQQLVAVNPAAPNAPTRTLEHIGNDTFREGTNLFTFSTRNGARRLIVDQGGGVYVLHRVEP